MPRKPEIPCASCGRLMWWCSSSLPAGQATCQPCRRIAKGCGPDELQPKWAPAPLVMEWRICKKCATPFEANARKHKVYCNPECRPHGSGSKAPRAERGYGREHARERRRVKKAVDAGQVDCCLCGHWIEPGTPWHLDHVPGTTDRYRGAAHASCNTSDGARRGNSTRPRDPITHRFLPGG